MQEYEPTIRLELNKKDSITTVAFQDQKLIFDTAVFSKTAYYRLPEDKNYDLFEQLNAYWKTLDFKTQAAIFACYQDIARVFESTNQINQVNAKLIPIVRELTKYHDLKAITDWVQFRANVVVPGSFHVAYIAEKDRDSYSNLIQASTREKTYLRDDYIKLVGFTVALRCMLPIWGEYILRAAEEIDTKFKENYAGALLKGSSFENSEAYQKLYAYVQANIKPDETKTSGILDGVSSEDFPFWFTCLVMVRRLIIGDVRGLDEKSTLVSYLHNYIFQRAKNYESSFSFGHTQDKSLRTSQTDEESKISVLENYKIQEEFSPGDLVKLNHHGDNVALMRQVLCPDLDTKIVHQAMEAAHKALDNNRIHDPQIQIMQWIIGPYLPPPAQFVINKLQTINCIAMAQAILWFKGYRELAPFLTCTAMEKTEAMRVTTQVTRSNIPKNLMDDLGDLYPHFRRPSSRQVLNKGIPTPANEIRSLVQTMLESDWRMNIHDSWLSQLDTQNLPNTRRHEYRVPADIRVILARLATRIARHPIPFDPSVPDDVV